jgi:hypothetical protein
LDVKQAGGVRKLLAEYSCGPEHKAVTFASIGAPDRIS